MESTRPIRALLRGLDALTVLNLRDGATVSQIAQEIRLPRTTVYRILETLCNAGFAFRDSGDDRYRLTIRVRGLSGGFDDEAWVSQIAKPAIQDLCRQIVWPVSIATLSGMAMMTRESTDHSTPLAMERQSVGLCTPLLSTSTGLAYLAHSQTSQRDALLDRLGRSDKKDDRLARENEHKGRSLDPVQGRAALLRTLAEIKMQGYAITTRTDGQAEEISLSVPVLLAMEPEHAGSSVGDISGDAAIRDSAALASLTVRFDAAAMPEKSAIERLLPELRRCAAKISALFAERQAETQPAKLQETPA